MLRALRQLGTALLCAALSSVFVSLPVLAQTSTVTANQGRPMGMGPWQVREFGASLSTTASSGRNATTPTATTTVISASGVACTAAGGASCTIIYASTDWLQWSNLTITIRNSGANTIDNVLVEWSANNSNFEVWDSTTFATLTTGQIRSLAIAGNSRRYLRIEARSTSGSTAVVNITANDG